MVTMVSPEDFYEVVVWDATGPTGRLVCGHLARHSTVRWAIGGRRLDPLEKLRDLLVAPGYYACPPSGIVVSCDRNAPERIARSCSVLINATETSLDLAAACAASGTHYVDDCDVLFARKSISLNERKAIKSGAKLVHCCGSLTCDILVALALKALRRRHGQDADSCVAWADSFSGAERFLSLNLEKVRTAIDSTSLCGEQESGFSRSFFGDATLLLPGYDRTLRSWHAPSFSADDKIVRRSRRLLRDVPVPRRKFVFRKVVKVAGPFSALVGGLLSGWFDIDSHGTRLEVFAKGNLGEEVRGEAVVNKPRDASTAVMMAETALCLLASDADGASSSDVVLTPTRYPSAASGGGVLTPAVFSDQLINRLAKHGISFEIFANTTRGSTRRRIDGFTSAMLSTILFTILILVRIPELICSPPALFIPIAFVTSYGIWRCSPTTTAALAGVCVVLASNIVLATSWREPPLGTLSGQRWLVTHDGYDLRQTLSRQLAHHGAEVLSACALVNCGGRAAVDHLELADFASIDAFVKKHREPFDGIVLNDVIVDSTRGGLSNDKTRKDFYSSIFPMSKLHAGQARLVRGLNKQRPARVLVVSDFAAGVTPSFYGRRLGDMSKNSSSPVVFSRSCTVFYCPYASAQAFLVSYALAHLESSSKRRDQQQLEFAAVAPSYFSSTSFFPFKLFARSSRRSTLPLLRAAIDDTVAGKIVDAQGFARDFQDEFCQGCAIGTATQVAEDFSKAFAEWTSSFVVDKTLSNSNANDSSEQEREITQVKGWRLTFLVATASLCFLCVARKPPSSFFDIGEASPPGPVLHFINAMVHHRFAAPFFEGASWAGMLAVGALFAPFALVVGSFRCLQQLLSKNSFWGDASRTAVVVTGCDSGFGKEVALKLSRMGYKVFALCLGNPRPIVSAARDFVDSTDRLPVGVHCDVTKDADVYAAADLVDDWLADDKNRVLGAVVNNAGVCTSGFLEWLDVSNLRHDMEVNYFGVHRVTRAFLPLLRRCRNSRICIVASTAGKQPTYCGGGYSASKHAVLGYASSLHLELKPLGIRVCCVSPSFHRTPMVNKGIDGLEKAWRHVDYRIKKAYGGEGFFRRVQMRMASVIRAVEWDHRHVVDAICDSVVHPNPRADTPVGLDARMVFEATRRLPRSVELALFEKFLGVTPPSPSVTSKEEEGEVFSPLPQTWADTIRSSSDQERQTSVVSPENAKERATKDE